MPSVNSSILGTICLLEPKCYLSPFTSQSQKKFCMGGTVPQFGGGIELGGSAVAPCETPTYYVKFVWWNRNYISLVYESIAKEIWHGEPSPNLGEGVELGVGCGTPRKSNVLGKIM